MARSLFQELRRLREVVVLFDEIDEMLRDRADKSQGKDGSMGILRFLIPGMLPKLQDLKQYGEKARLIFIIATNYFDRLDPAIKRKGRIDEHFLVAPQDLMGRRLACRRHLQKLHRQSRAGGDAKMPSAWNEVGDILAERMPGWVYRDITNILDRSFENRDLRAAVEKGGLKSVTVETLLKVHTEKRQIHDSENNTFEVQDYVMLDGFKRDLDPLTFYAGRPNANEQKEATTVIKLCWPELNDASDLAKYVISTKVEES
jgi:SpoVK/Ycf46/Vps4 family AAA+-type ATPase